MPISSASNHATYVATASLSSTEAGHVSYTSEPGTLKLVWAAVNTLGKPKLHGFHVKLLLGVTMS